jgi:hypothetical protein
VWSWRSKNSESGCEWAIVGQKSQAQLGVVSSGVFHYSLALISQNGGKV